jgi:hypothetical protein
LTLRSSRPISCASRRRPCLDLEALEGRNLLSAFALPVANETLDQYLELGNLDPGPPAPAMSVQGTGNLGHGPAGAADVAWFRFELSAAARVNLTATDPPGSGLISVLSLYNTDPWDFNPNSLNPPVTTPLGHRLLAQSQGPTLQADLAPGTYYVAVSGAGNRGFYPLLADSGTPGSTGNYALRVSATDLAFSGDGPMILGGDPAPGGSIDHAPLVLRVDLSAAVNIDTVHLNQAPNTIAIDPNDPAATLIPTVWLTNNQTGALVPLAAGDVGASANELRLETAAPLLPGTYTLTLLGDSSQNPLVLTDASTGTPLGTDAAHPFGQDLTVTFTVTGVEGTPVASGPAGVNPPPANDTWQNAPELGNVTRLVQVPGAIGDNPYLAASGIQAGADIDMYHFRVNGPGLSALDAEVFAGRIGSPLDAGLSLFRLNPTTQQLDYITGNDNSLNGSVATDGSVPLYTDPVLFAGLTAGDYYLVVSSSGNVPDPVLGTLPGDSNGIFDPNTNTPYSGGATLSTGNYLLNVLVTPAQPPTHVVSVTAVEGVGAAQPSVNLAPGTTLPGPPTQLVVGFDRPLTSDQVAWLSYQQYFQSTVNGIYFVGADGNNYFPRVQPNGTSGNQVTFLMLDALPPGPTQLHLGGLAGLSGAGNNPLLAGDPSSVIPFTVGGPVRGTPGNPTYWLDREPNNSPTQPQVLGPLFPRELTNGSVVTVHQDFSHAPGGADNFEIQVLQSQQYLLNLTGTRQSGLPGSAFPAGVVPEIYHNGQLWTQTLTQGSNGILVNLDPGVYVVRVSGWRADAAQYDLTISIPGGQDNPTPLTVGPAPAFRIRLASSAPSSGPAAPPLLVVPPPPATGPATVPVRETPGDPTAPLRLLLALTAAPLGGVTAGPTGDLAVAPSPDRLVVSGPQLVLKDRLLQVAILTQTGDVALSDLGGGGGDPTLTDLPTLLGQYASRVARSWQEALDSVFAPAADTGDPSGAAQPDAAPMEDSPYQDSDNPDEVNVRPPAGGGQWTVGSQETPAARSAVAADAAEQSSSLPTVHRPPSTEGRTLAAGGALAGALAGAWQASETSRKRRRRKTGSRR